mmetsp:Transcript_3304/g.7333  ORF Transcript_3304/g.7333 Transcript_3304/m.7333 type:complete len:214 (+) Transcript_3304:364-1005(+)
MTVTESATRKPAALLTLKNDSRLSTTLAACESVIGNANATHRAYQEQMAMYAKQLAELKLRGSISLLKDVYLRGILIISETLVSFEMTELEIDATTVMEYQLAVLAIKKALLEHVPEKHFEELAFLPTITKEQGTDEKKIELKKFWKGEDNNHVLTQPRSVVNDGSVEGLYEVNCNEVHPKQSDDDITIVNAVAQKLYPLIPSISTELFKAKK